MRCIPQALLAIPLSFLMTSPLFAVGASGITTQLVGTKALGQGNAFVAQADDPSAVFFNPAGMTQLKGPQVSLGAALLLPIVDRTGNSVTDDRMNRQMAALPHFYATIPLPALGDKKAAAGIGLTSPFGLTTDWAPTGSLRYVATVSTFKMLNINPSIAIDALPTLSLGAGIDYVHLLNTESRFQFNAGLGDADGTSKLSGHGSGWGYNVGALYKPVEKHSFGLTYRSQVRLPIKGNVELSNIGPTTQAVFGFTSANYTATANSGVILPASILGGYAFKPSDRWTFLLDYEWTQWSVFQNQDVAFDETAALKQAFLTGGTGPNANVSRTSREWHNVSSVGAGANYKVSDAWQVRGGYAYFEKTVPNTTFSPDVPDTTSHLISTGFTRSWEAIIVDFAFNSYIYVNRPVSNSVGSATGSTVNGTYKAFVPALALTFTYKFAG